VRKISVKTLLIVVASSRWAYDVWVGDHDRVRPDQAMCVRSGDAVRQAAAIAEDRGLAVEVVRLRGWSRGLTPEEVADVDLALEAVGAKVSHL